MREVEVPICSWENEGAIGEALSVLQGVDIPRLTTFCRAKASVIPIMLGEHFEPGSLLAC